MLRFKKTLTTSFIFLGHFCFGQSKSFEVVFEPSICTGCKANLTDTNYNYKDQFFNLKSSIIELALDRALENNDKRVVAISGLSILFPGLDTKDPVIKDKYDKHLIKYGYKIVWGTSDVVNSSAPGLQSAAYEFAKKYNTLLFKRLAD